MRSRRGNPVAVALVVLAACAATLGCPGRLGRDAAQVAPPNPPEVFEPPITPQPPPEPTAADLAVQAAEKVLARGEFHAAVEQYEKAAALEADPARQADIHFALAMIYADTGSGLRNIEHARQELDKLLALDPMGERAHEARVMSILISELMALRSGMIDQQGEIEALKEAMAALKADLAKKDLELENIKKVLLQKKTP